MFFFFFLSLSLSPFLLNQGTLFHQPSIDKWTKCGCSFSFEPIRRHAQYFTGFETATCVPSVNAKSLNQQAARYLQTCVKESPWCVCCRRFVCVCGVRISLSLSLSLCVLFAFIRCRRRRRRRRKDFLPIFKKN